MRTRVLMIASAAAMAIAGLLLTFAPQEILAWGGGRPGGIGLLPAQAAGALYIGFAALNWLARDVVIGGIYSRPVALGNFVHFFMMAAALTRLSLSSHHNGFILLLTLLYVVFAAAFGFVLFTSPRRLTE